MNDPEDEFERMFGRMMRGYLATKRPSVEAAQIASRAMDARPGVLTRVARTAGAAATLTAATLAVLIVFGLRSAAFGPTASMPTAAGSSSSTALTRFSSSGLSFDYPSAWRVISVGVAEHYANYGPVLGTGDWELPCRAIPSGGQCGPVAWTVPPGTVVVAFESSSLPALAPAAPPGAVRLPSGLLASEAAAASSAVWTVFVPSRTVGSIIFPARIVTVEARFAGSNSAVSHEEVTALVWSLSIGS